jgi:hypothetical protein
MISVEEIKKTIDTLSLEHNAVGDDLEDLKDSDWIEKKAENLIIEYCKNMNYQINGFPKDKMREASKNEDFDEDYFCRERYQMYLDMLAINQSEVADLMWHYTSKFWPEQFISKEEYIDHISKNIESGTFYDISF